MRQHHRYDLTKAELEAFLLHEPDEVRTAVIEAAQAFRGVLRVHHLDLYGLWKDDKFEFPKAACSLLSLIESLADLDEPDREPLPIPPTPVHAVSL